jgi:hypothetical protein
MPTRTYARSVSVAMDVFTAGCQIRPDNRRTLNIYDEVRSSIRQKKPLTNLIAAT